MMAHFRNNSLW